MKIRKIKAHELTPLLDLYQHLHTADDPLPAESVVQSVWGEIENNPAVHCFGLFLEKMLVSSCILVIVPNLTRGCRPYGLIENVVTHAEHRGKGLGKEILHHTLDFAWQQNCYKVMLMTGRLNEQTFRFYESVGFNRHSKQAFIARPE